MQRLYVGNLPYSMTEQEVRKLFSPFGLVHSVTLIADRYTGKMRGFGFVEMENGAQAIAALDGQEYGGRKLRVNACQDKNVSRRQKNW